MLVVCNTIISNMSVDHSYAMYGNVCKIFCKRLYEKSRPSCVHVCSSILFIIQQIEGQISSIFLSSIIYAFFWVSPNISVFSDIYYIALKIVVYLVCLPHCISCHDYETPCIFKCTYINWYKSAVIRLSVAIWIVQNKLIFLNKVAMYINETAITLYYYYYIFRFKISHPRVLLV